MLWAGNYCPKGGEINHYQFQHSTSKIYYHNSSIYVQTTKLVGSVGGGEGSCHSELPTPSKALTVERANTPQTCRKVSKQTAEEQTDSDLCWCSLWLGKMASLPGDILLSARPGFRLQLFSCMKLVGGQQKPMAIAGIASSYPLISISFPKEFWYNVIAQLSSLALYVWMSTPTLFFLMCLQLCREWKKLIQQRIEKVCTQLKMH